MRQGILVDGFPVSFHESGDQQEQGALRLVEVGDDPSYDLERVARGDDDPRRRHQRIRMVPVQEIEDVLKGSLRCQPVVVRIVGHPLTYDEILGGRLRIALQDHAHVIEAFQGPYGGRPHGDDVSKFALDALDGATAYGDEFRVHLVPLDRVAFHRLEGSRPDMQGDLFPSDAPGVYVGEHLRREMEPGGRCGHGAFYLGIDRLIGL